MPKPSKAQPELADYEVEQALLGSLLIDPGAIYTVRSSVHPMDFAKEAYRWIFEAILDLAADGSKIDILTVGDRVTKAGHESAEGGMGIASFLTGLISSVPTAVHAEEYAKIIHGYAIRRQLVDAACQIVKEAWTAETHDDALVSALRRVSTINDTMDTRMLPTSEATDSLVERATAWFETPKEVWGIPTGLRDLDNVMGGLERPELILLAGRPGVGKSAMALQIARHVAGNGLGVAYFSLEMGLQHLMLRLACSGAKLDSDLVKRGRISPEEKDKFWQEMAVLTNLPIWWSVRSAIPVGDVATEVAKLQTQRDIGLVVIDYLQLMAGDGENQNIKITNIAQGLASMAKQTNACVMALSQLNRAVEARTDRQPRLSDLRDSGCVSADTLVALADGTHVPIANLVGKAPDVLTVNPDGIVGVGRASKVWQTGVKPAFQVTTNCGRSVTATSNHPFWTRDGWRKLESLSPGEEIAAVVSYPEPMEVTAWDDARTILLAHLIGNGCYLHRRPIHYTDQNEDNLQAVEAATLSAFGITARRVRQKTWYHLYLSTGANKWHPNPVTEWLRELGVYDHRAHEKHIPDEIFALSAGHVALFLQHLWATDGTCCVCRSHVTGRKATIMYSTTSVRLAWQVQQLLARLGIRGSIRLGHKKGYRDSYMVSVDGKRDQMQFIEAIGAFGPRKPGLSSGKEVLSKKEAHPPERLGNLAWDKVREIKAVGEMPVYDLTVPETHNFIGNGITLHNSLEQAADKILFIWRPDDTAAMNIEQRKGIITTPIALAKNRNGVSGLGLFNLGFMGKWSLFVHQAKEKEPLA